MEMKTNSCGSLKYDESCGDFHYDLNPDHVNKNYWVSVCVNECNAETNEIVSYILDWDDRYSCSQVTYAEYLKTFPTSELELAKELALKLLKKQVEDDIIDLQTCLELFELLPREEVNTDG